jgi:hypothetical protein
VTVPGPVSRYLRGMDNSRVISALSSTTTPTARSIASWKDQTRRPSATTMRPSTFPAAASGVAAYPGVVVFDVAAVRDRFPEISGIARLPSGFRLPTAPSTPRAPFNISASAWSVRAHP